MQAAQTLAVAPEHPAARRITAQAHSDLLALERTIGDNGKLRTEIAVADVRRTVAFFGSTAGEGGWRICIVDSVDELNRFGTNALLKILEEPPARSLAVPAQPRSGPGAAYDPIALPPAAAASACTPDDVARAAGEVAGRDATDEALRRAAALADGSIARAIALVDGPSLALHDGVATLLARLPEVDPRALHLLGDGLGGRRGGVRDVPRRRPRLALDAPRIRARTGRMARVASVWEKFNQAAADVAVFNLERKPLVFHVRHARRAGARLNPLHARPRS